MKEVYLDNSATTRVCEAAAQKALYMMTECYGNPSSLHAKGFEAHRELEKARQTAAELLGAEPSEICFTSGGTESNNTAIFGAAAALRRRGNRIVTTAIEHSSVLEAAEKLQKDGFEVIFLPPDHSGRISREALVNAVNEKTILVSVMTVNNETGAIQPVEAIRRIIDRAGAPALLHTDAVQAFGKMPLKPKKWGVDLLSASAHKIHGPKGAGLLYIRRGVRILPLHYGGEQEDKRRPGTEPIALLCAMGEAIRALPEMNEALQQMRELNSYCRQQLGELQTVSVNSDEECWPYILNFSLKGIRSETLLHHLEERHIYVSSGSACAKGKKSHVLTAMRLEPALIESALRVSFCSENTRGDVDRLVEALINAEKTLARSG